MTTSPPDLPGDADPARAVLEEAAEVLESALSPAEEAAVEVLDVPRRLLLVHAHPDDETTGTGVTMAKYAAEGASVTLVTCTRGEEGEVVTPDLSHLHSGAEDRLGERRVEELAIAMEALGVSDFRFLGQPGQFRDSGMVGTPTTEHPHAFARADVGEAARLLAEVLREVRPQVLVTYDERGGYGHPDHVMAHRVAMRAVDLAADPTLPGLEPWSVAKVYWSVIPRERMLEGMRRMRAAGVSMDWAEDEAEFAEFTTPDELVTTEIDGRAHLDAKIAAWRAHASQISEDFFFLQVPAGMREEVFGVEHFQLVRGSAVPDPDRADGLESDLFAGVS